MNEQFAGLALVVLQGQYPLFEDLFTRPGRGDRVRRSHRRHRVTARSTERH